MNHHVRCSNVESKPIIIFHLQLRQRVFQPVQLFLPFCRRRPLASTVRQSLRQRTLKILDPLCSRLGGSGGSVEPSCCCVSRSGCSSGKLCRRCSGGSRCCGLFSVELLL